MSKVFAAALLAVGVVSDALLPGEIEFMHFIAQWNKSYGTREEYNLRLKRFLEIDAFIQEVNAPGSEYTHTAGHNRFSDWTETEFNRMMSLDKSAHSEPEPIDESIVLETDLPNGSVDWRTGGCVTAVKDQGNCGSCWAFAVTETMESSYCIDGGALYVLSPQQLVDCCTVYAGCNGGDYWGAWEYFETHGQELNSVYPYTARDGTCEYKSSEGLVGTTSTPDVRVGQYVSATSAQMMDGVNIKPNAVGINASGINFQTYSSGVLTTCTKTMMNHAVVIEGYDSSASEPYWLVRNSWGASWGEQGYIRIGFATGKGLCGINQDVGYPNTKAWN